MGRNLVQYLKEGRERGFSDKVLKEDLLDNGFSESQIKKGFARLEGNDLEEEPDERDDSSKDDEKESGYSGSKVPKGVKACSIIYYVNIGLLLIMPLIVIILSNVAGSSSGASLFSIGGTIMGVVLLAVAIPIAILFFFIARGLKQGKNWARVTAIVLSALSFLGSFGQLANGSYWIALGAINLILGGFVAGYLIISGNAKDFFE